MDVDDDECILKIEIHQWCALVVLISASKLSRDWWLFIIWNFVSLINDLSRSLCCSLATAVVCGIFSYYGWVADCRSGTFNVAPTYDSNCEPASYSVWSAQTIVCSIERAGNRFSESHSFPLQSKSIPMPFDSDSQYCDLFPFHIIPMTAFPFLPIFIFSSYVAQR